MKTNRKEENQEFNKWLITKQVRRVMEIRSDSGIVAKSAVLSGLDRRQTIRFYAMELCGNDSLCQCPNLHAIQLPSGLTIIVDWHYRLRQCCITPIPTQLWQNFRSLVGIGESDIERADKIVRASVGVGFNGLRSIFLDVMTKAMNQEQMKALKGTAEIEVAQNCLSNSDSFVKHYTQAWQKFNIIVPVL